MTKMQHWELHGEPEEAEEVLERDCECWKVQHQMNCLVNYGAQNVFYFLPVPWVGQNFQDDAAG
jgi:hypothetical protein